MIKTKNNIVIFLYLYVTLVLTRYKHTSLIKIDGLSFERIVLIITFISITMLITNWKNIRLSKKNTILSLFLMIIISLGFFKNNEPAHSLYALSLAITPIFALLYGNSTQKTKNIVFLLVVFINVFYSILIIFTSFNYEYVMQLIGNTSSNLIDIRQHRTGTMLGTSIATSIYQTLTLVLMFHYKEIEMFKSRKLYYVAISLNVISTFLLLSRLPFLVMILIIMIKISRNIIDRVNVRALFTNLVVLLFIVLLFKNTDINISRLFKGFSDKSTMLRISALHLGLNIFLDNFLFGSGLATYYKRIYHTVWVNYNGTISLIDPHNLFVLILSEIGILGFLILLLFGYYNRQNINYNGKLLVFIMLLNGLGGSHLVNNPNVAIVFWFYLAIMIDDEKGCKFEDSQYISHKSLRL